MVSVSTNPRLRSDSIAVPLSQSKILRAWRKNSIAIWPKFVSKEDTCGGPSCSFLKDVQCITGVYIKFLDGSKLVPGHALPGTGQKLPQETQLPCNLPQSENVYQ